MADDYYMFERTLAANNGRCSDDLAGSDGALQNPRAGLGTLCVLW
ncbi:MAG TPA: hypothetical protein VMS31_04810 [Pyrinomonadaceae bacterium]|nr:hypothetical protein [Pyrinomonadaceae bacterium]